MTGRLSTSGAHAAGGRATPDPPGDPSQWTLTFSDEFDGTALDPNTWTAFDAFTNTGVPATASELAWYSPDAVQVSDGTLKLIARKESTEPGYPYTSGQVQCWHSFSQLYGYFEARIKMPAGKGLWPAFWLLPQPITWPPEIDVMEYLGGEPNVIHMSNHWSRNYPSLVFPYDGSFQAGEENTTYVGTNYSTAFHTFGVDWSPTAVVWYIDGVQRFRVTGHVPVGGRGLTGMYMIANLAVGGWAGTPDANTVFPAQMEVDYIRVYSKTATADTTPPVISSVSVSSVTSTSATIRWTTDEASDTQINYGVTAAYGSATTLDPSLVTAHSQAVTGLSPSTTYHFQAEATDASDNTSRSGDYSFTTAAQADTAAPVRSNGAPAGTLPAGTTSALLSLSTNEAASCRYSTRANTSYSYMTTFSATGASTHSRTLTGLTNGSSYRYYVKCRDAVGNTNTDDYGIAFGVAAAIPTASFSASPGAIVSGQSSTLTWAASNAAMVTIDNGVGTVPASGSRSVTPVQTTTYTLTASSTAGSVSKQATVTVTPQTGDATPPLLSGGSPAGSLPRGTTSTVISLKTDEAATCKYSNWANVAYTSMSSTFTTTGGTAHSRTVSGLSNGRSYRYYVKCKDQAGNANTSDYVISFSVRWY